MKPGRPSALALAQIATAAAFAVFWLNRTSVLYLSSNLDYQAYDWMVSYAAGFVRRGLPGELAFRAAEVTGAGPLMLIKLAGALTMTAFLLLYVRRIWRQPVLTPSEKFCLLAMPTGVSFVLLNNAVSLRRDYIALLVFLGFLALADGAGRLRIGWIGAYLGSAGTLAILVHEQFLLLFMPYIALLVHARLAGEHRRPVARAGRLAAVLLIPCLAGVAVLNTRLNAAGVERVCFAASRSIEGVECSPPPPALSMLQGNAEDALAESYAQLLRRQVASVPAMAVWLIAYLLFARVLFEIQWRMVLANLGEGGEVRAQQAAFGLAVMNTILLVGMSAVGIDVGRWIFLVSTISTLCACSPGSAPGLVQALSAPFSRFHTISALVMKPRAYAVSILAAGFSSWIFRFEHCCVVRLQDFLWSYKELARHYPSLF